MAEAGVWSTYFYPLFLTVGYILAIVVPLLLVLAFITYFERKVWAAIQLRKGPNVVGPLRPAAAGGGRDQVPVQGDHRPRRRQPHALCAGADGDLQPGPHRLGGDPLRPAPRARRPERRVALPLRGLFARGLRHHHRGLGQQLEVRLPRCAALGGADGLLRGLHRLRAGDGVALRRLAQPQRHRRGAEGALVLHSAVPDVRDLRGVRAGRDQPHALRSAGGRGRAGGRLPGGILVDDLAASS